MPDIQSTENQKRGALAQIALQKAQILRKISFGEHKRAPKNAVVYIVLAFCFGAIGIHNFYAGYWKRGVVQFLLTLIAPYMLFIPLFFTSVWALLELLFVHRSANGEFMVGNHKLVVLLKLVTILIIVWFASYSELILKDMDLELLQRTGDSIIQVSDMEELK